MIEILKNIETDELIEILRKNNPNVKDIEILDFGYFFHLLKSGEVEKAMSFVQGEQSRVSTDAVHAATDDSLGDSLEF